MSFNSKSILIFSYYNIYIIKYFMYPSILVTFEDIFNDEILDFENIRSRFSLNNIALICSQISAYIWSKENDQERQNELFLYLMTGENQIEVNYVSSNINKINPKVPKYLFSHVSCLMLMHYHLNSTKKYNYSEILNDRNYLIFKQILFCNSEFTGTIEKIQSIFMQKDFKDKLILMFIVFNLGQSEFSGSKNNTIFSQILKCYEFIKYISSKDEYKIAYSYFVNIKNVKDGYEYLKILMSTIIRFFNINQKTDFKNIKCVIRFDKTQDKEKLLFDSISINDEYLSNFEKDLNMDYDFKLYRDRPLFKLNNSEYAILNFKFFFDKIFNGLLYDFYKCISMSDKNIKFVDFKSVISKDYSQNILFNDTIKIIFDKYHSTLIPERLYKKYEYGDYIVIIGNKLLLFEYKDITLSANIKNSYEYSQIINYLEDRLIVKSGIKQIINTIDNIYSRRYDFLNSYLNKIGKIEIYPIIVYSDLSLNAQGINYFINKRFKNFLNGKYIDLHVRDITMINLDFLLFYRELINMKKFNFINIIDRYINYINKNEKYFDIQSGSAEKCLETFEMFFENYVKKVRKIQFNSSNELKEIYKKLYNSKI